MGEEAKTKEESKPPVTKEKMRSIMEAASALTALGDDESEEGRPSSPTSSKKKEEKSESSDSSSEMKISSPKRYLPEHKKPDAAPTFPEKLMQMMEFADTQGENFCVTWLEDGMSFIIKNQDEFTRKVVPQYFKPTKFSSFTRKLYRWGFRQINRGIGPDDPIIFGNDYFQRDRKELMSKMRSVTAAGNRKADQDRSALTLGKRAIGVQFDVNSQKRMLYDHFMQQKAGYMAPNPSIYGMNGAGPISLTSALRPMIGGNTIMPMSQNNGMMKAYDLNQTTSDNRMHQYIQPRSVGVQYPTPQSTAEIVEAAIAALRYAK